MNAPILSFFAAHAPRQVLHRGRRRRFFRCPACRAVQIVPAGCGQTKIVSASAGRYSYGELEYDRGPLMEGLHKEEGSAEFVLPSFI